MDRKVLFYLFKSFATSFYGIDLWYDKIYAYQINTIAVAYHKAVKKICGLNVWDNNHNACDIAGVSIFKHLLAKRKLCFWQNLCKSKSACLSNLRYYCRYKSHMYLRLKELFRVNYQVDISDNPLCALLARIKYLQRTEPRSNYMIEA